MADGNCEEKATGDARVNSFNNSVVDHMAAISTAHERMSEIEREITPLRNQVYMLEVEWERLGREASNHFNKMLRESGNG